MKVIIVNFCLLLCSCKFSRFNLRNIKEFVCTIYYQQISPLTLFYSKLKIQPKFLAQGLSKFVKFCQNFLKYVNTCCIMFSISWNFVEKCQILLKMSDYVEFCQKIKWTTFKGGGFWKSLLPSSGPSKKRTERQ